MNVLDFWEVGLGTRNNGLNFEIDADPDLNPGSIFHFSSTER